MRINRHTELEVYQKPKQLYAEYDGILGMIVCMNSNPDTWSLPNPSK